MAASLIDHWLYSKVAASCLTVRSGHNTSLYRHYVYVLESSMDPQAGASRYSCAGCAGGGGGKGAVTLPSSRKQSAVCTRSLASVVRQSVQWTRGRILRSTYLILALPQTLHAVDMYQKHVQQ